MKLVRLRLCNFQSFGSIPTTVEMRNVTFVLGPNRWLGPDGCKFRDRSSPPFV